MGFLSGKIQREGVGGLEGWLGENHIKIFVNSKVTLSDKSMDVYPFLKIKIIGLNLQSRCNKSTKSF